MRKTLLAVATLVSAAGFVPTPAGAVDYPWCAEYIFDATNCGFTTHEQCLATINGIGGYCRPNPMYRGPERSEVRKHKRRHRNPED